MKQGCNGATSFKLSEEQRTSKPCGIQYTEHSKATMHGGMVVGAQAEGALHFHSPLPEPRTFARFAPPQVCPWVVVGAARVPQSPIQENYTRSPWPCCIKAFENSFCKALGDQTYCFMTSVLALSHQASGMLVVPLFEMGLTSLG